jgi:pimeloyl-ACP methyl ester carboxylesterase
VPRPVFRTNQPPAPPTASDDLETWAFQEQELTAAGYRLLLFDNRGIGRTSKPAGPYSSQLRPSR